MDFVTKNLPYLLAGISTGGQYALIAIGYTMVYGILRLINFAHGDVFMAAGLILIYAHTVLPLFISIPLTVIFTVILGFAVERIAYKPLRNAPRMSIMISAIGMSYLLQNLALYVTGGLTQYYPSIPWISPSTVLGCFVNISHWVMAKAFPIYSYRPYVLHLPVPKGTMLSITRNRQRSAGRLTPSCSTG